MKMQDMDTPVVHTGNPPRHPAAVVSACALSFAVHVLLAIIISRIGIHVLPIIRDAVQLPRPKPMNVVDVRKTVPPDMVSLPGPVDGIPGDGGAAAAKNVEGRVESMGRAPETANIEPPAIVPERLKGEQGSIVEPAAVPKRGSWEPRQEVVAIEKAVFEDKVDDLRRRLIPRGERVKNAPDIVMPVEVKQPADTDTRLVDKAAGQPSTQQDLTGLVKGGTGRWGGPGGGRPIPQIPDMKPPVTPDAAEDAAKKYKALEKYLKAELTVYNPLFESKYGYFKIAISRLNDEVLPVTPKDVLLVQDVSASMTENRLHFCRDALIRCLSEIAANDRFNIIRFKDSTEMCFKDWQSPTAANVEMAKGFIADLKSTGNTDIFVSISDLLKMPRTTGRPVIAVMVTDGRPTVGLVRSSDIIGKFTRDNDGAISVFTLGARQTANAYLLDLLTYCNRGDSYVVDTGRWDIPEATHNMMKQVSRPVLADVRFTFTARDGCEVFPVLTGNLYMDKPLVVYGRYRRDMQNVVFRATGKAGNIDCDMVFDLPFSKSERGDKSIRTDWAKHKVYHLISQYARKSDQSVRDEMEATAGEYRIKIPHRGDF